MIMNSLVKLFFEDKLREHIDETGKRKKLKNEENPELNSIGVKRGRENKIRV